jgi:hypothetical protein
VRGGAIAVVALAGLLALLGVLNLVWTGTAIQAGSFGFAVLAIGGLAGALTLTAREAIRRGPPGPREEPETVPGASLAAMLAALGFGSFVFGFAFGRFPLYFGIGLMVAAAGRLVLELRAQRRWRGRR